MAYSIFQQGKQARVQGKPMDHNPYQSGSAERRQWYLGWCEENLLEFMRDPSIEQCALAGVSTLS